MKIIISNKKSTVEHNELFTLGEDVLVETTESLDLGLIFTKSLSFHQHIAKVCSKAKSLIFLLKKRFLSKNAVYLNPA